MPLPSAYKKAFVLRKSKDFDEIDVSTIPLVEPKPDEVLVRNWFVGVNATDLNAVSCQLTYAEETPPFGLGCEGLGEIVSFGSNVSHLKVGQPVAHISKEAYSEYSIIHATEVWCLPEINPEYLGLLIAGLTAVIGLDKQGHIKKEDKVLITAAAGGTGQIAVQWAKRAGCHVIGTCSSDEKANYLKSIGCDRPINYKKEDLGEVLKKEYPEGVDVIWETVGGATFNTLFQHLAFCGRMIIVGAISTYNTGDIFKNANMENLHHKLVHGSYSISGFYLRRYKTDVKEYFKSILKMHSNNEMKAHLDMGKNSEHGEFVGVESVPRALKYLQSGKNTGKVIIKIKHEKISK